ncbi:hypothetical protein [Cellulomonas soli]|uniref:Integral membrane protein n=1 Tax=Cellulomonas soli TaxID=931535 RepID=A0A512PA01_9CELL|nr:hypothetical protein [Cellulomonas soli]NYI60519.1 hypothetical protein [Cellulomonas soli]GEP68034.1 hypothetical protein CSO01_07490 [Cellulomonas soli]
MTGRHGWHPTPADEPDEAGRDGQVPDEEAPVELAVHRLAGAIYGTILATTVVVTIGNHPENLDRALVLVAGTSVVFWMAHVYARGLAARVVARRSLHRWELWALARSEWPMLQSSWPILLVLALGRLDVIDPQRSIDVATAVGIGALFTYGYVIGRQEGLSWPRVALNALVSGSFGLAILFLKVLVH